MQIQFILLAAAFGYLRKFLQKEDQMPHWQKAFFWGVVASVVFLIIETTYPVVRPFSNWVARFAFIGLTWIAVKEPVFKPIRNKIFIVLPYILVKIIVDLVKAINSDFYYQYKSYFQAAVFFAFIWLVVMLIINNQQRKALAAEKAKAAESERELQLTEKLKAQLEIQVQERTSELLIQKQSLEHAIRDLKATQTQLIQAEKMASLGELTAGIAHEIQNPLNFVNNFSDLNQDLINEMLLEISLGNLEETKAIANDIKSNEEKINYHGKRADSIVKGMLQHSRSSSGQKELTDINQLCDEYLRLAYHGLRAKDKSFNASFETRFDERIEKVSLVPQDIGRVLLNLINNAFYAVSDKKKLKDDAYKPTVEISTKLVTNQNGQRQVEIRVMDNGAGVPELLKDKIFQPFFTTKPTGKGTGLGLSLSYDIIRAHDGYLQVESQEGEGSTFIIQLPA